MGSSSKGAVTLYPDLTSRSMKTQETNKAFTYISYIGNAEAGFPNQGDLQTS
jgi:hypothetical protein